jgi:tetratricopeptide (TPR) repeat protein
LEISRALLEGGKLLVTRLGTDVPAPIRSFVEQATAAAATRDRAEQEAHLREAQKLAAANRRTAQVTSLLFVLSLLCVGLVSWSWYGTRKQLGLTHQLLGLAEELSTELSKSNSTFSDVLIANGDFDAAVKSYQSEIHALEGLEELDPNNANWPRDLAIAYDNEGRVLKTKHDFVAALAAYGKALAIREMLLKRNPRNLDWALERSDSYVNIGDVHFATGNFEEALKFYQQSRTIRDQLARSDRNNPAWQYAVGMSEEKLGDVFNAQGHRLDALKAYLTSLDIRLALAKTSSSNPTWQRDLWITYQKLANAYLSLGKRAEALEALAKGRAIIQDLVKEHPDQTLKNGLAWFDEQIAQLRK